MAKVRSQSYRYSHMWSLKVVRNVSKVIVKDVIVVKEYMIHERTPDVKSKVVGIVACEVVKS